jgi:prepilin-type N-terminal cleavage/methylation domain-containing protein
MQRVYLRPTVKDRSESGFSLPELMIATAILLIISSTVTSGLLQLTSAQKTIANRTEMHNGVRSATELLQQEVGQAGRVALPGAAGLGGAVAIGAQTVVINQTVNGVTAPSVSGIFPGEQLTIDAGPNQETVAVTSITSATKEITATFVNAHAPGAIVAVFGGFASGIVPSQKPDGTPYPNGSTATKLKMFGDINSDGNMVYVEYTCDPLPPSLVPTASPPGTGNLYRNVMPFDQTTAKVAPPASQALLTNIQTNPGGIACFTYLPSPLPVISSIVDPGCNCAGLGQTFVLDVAITLTVQTQLKDPITNAYQTETKALLNVSPRNVFNVWELASASGQLSNRVQPMPPTVKNLLP